MKLRMKSYVSYVLFIHSRDRTMPEKQYFFCCVTKNEIHLNHNCKGGITQQNASPLIFTL